MVRWCVILRVIGLVFHLPKKEAPRSVAQQKEPFQRGGLQVPFEMLETLVWDTANGPQRESADTVSFCLVPCNKPEKLSRSIPFKTGLVKGVTQISINQVWLLITDKHNLTLTIKAEYENHYLLWLGHSFFVTLGCKVSDINHLFDFPGKKGNLRLALLHRPWRMW